MNVDQRTIQIHLLVSLGSYIKYDQQLIFNSQNQEYNMRLAEELISQAYFLKMKKLEETLLKCQIIPYITADNAVKYL